MKLYFENRTAEIFEMSPPPTFQELHGPFIVTTESTNDIKKLLGKSWDQVISASFWDRNFSIPCWLSQKGLKYYLPAIIISSTSEYELTGTTSIAADTVVSILELYTNKDWEIYSDDQQELIFEWIDYLKLNFSSICFA